MNAGAVLYPGGVRLSTWVMIVALIATGTATRRPWRGLAAVAAFYFGTEVAYQLIAWYYGRAALPAWWTAPTVLAVTWALGARPDWRLLAPTCAAWVLWIATGFHVNAHAMAGFNPAAEAMNEGAKTLFGLAYLVPLVRQSVAAPPALGLRSRRQLVAKALSFIPARAR